MKRIIGAVLVSVLALGCGLSEAELAGDDQGQLADSEDGLSASSQSYVVARRDMRRCASPYCGGYFIHDVNRKTLTERYVSGLDLGPTGLSDSEQAKVFEAADGELLLRGKLGPIDANTNTRAFIVSEAYRGMPGVTVAAGDAFYVAKARDPQINCLAAPCNNQQAKQLNHTGWTYFTGYSVEGAAKPFVDQTWLTARIQNHGAIVAGHFANGQKYAAGYESLLAASQVFIRLPDSMGPCPKIAVRYCSGGTVNTWSRNADRCLVPSACVTPGMCALYMPVCADGYTLTSWRSGQFGCNAYACDPTFVVE